MPYKSGKLKGQLTSTELRKLISAHNKLYTIKVPSGATQPQIVKLINDNGYSVNHKTQQLRLRFKDLPKKITKDDAPKKKVATDLEKQKKEEKKKERDDKKKKEIREIKKQALKEDADRKKKNSKPKKKDEVRPKEKVGRPKFDPKKIEVIKKKSSPKPRRKLKGRLTSVRQETTMELEKLFPEYYAEDRELSMRTMGYVRDVLSVYQKIKSIGTTTQKTEARKIYEMFSGYRGDDKSQFDSYKKQFESILTKPKSKPEPTATIKKVVSKPTSKPQEPPKKEIMKEIIDDWGSDTNNVVIEQNHKKLKDGIISLWDSDKKFINIDGLFQFDKKLFNELFMKYPAKKVIEGLKNFMLYITDSDDEERIGQGDFSKWFEIRDGRTQSQIRGKDLNQSTLSKLIKEWDSQFGKKKEVPKAKKVEPKKEVAKPKENTELDKLVMKLENPMENLKPAKARKETLYAVSVLLLNKKISFEDFRKIIDAFSVYDSEFGSAFPFSFDKGQAPPKWRKKLSILIRKGIKAISFDANPDDIKNVWTEWTDMLPKTVKTEPTGGKKAKSEDTIKKQFEESKKLIKEFETLNKGFEKKDFSKLKKRYDYEQLINYKLFIKGANMMLRLYREKLDDDMDKKVKEQVKKNNQLKNKIDTIYKQRKK